MLDRAQARAIAEDWCAAWNRRDLDAVMAHYAEEVELSSPKVVERLGRADGWLKGKQALRAYFATGMQAPRLNFELIEVLVGTGALSIVYRRENGALVSDTMELDECCRGRRIVACYGTGRT
jgi:ketosteroid isomerase-like protein